MSINFLVSVYNISGYLMSELAALSELGAKISILRTRYNDDPDELRYPDYRWIDRPSFTESDIPSLLKESFDVYLCCGWADRLCLRLAKVLHDNGTKTVLSIDTPWQGVVKQYVHCLMSRFYLTRIFDWAWGAGVPQTKYLRLLGFSERRVRAGYYCADTNLFGPIGDERTACPHVFLYVGRYASVKNMRRMERAFLKAVSQVPDSDWILRCVGGGDLWDERTIDPRIEHLGWKSPEEIRDCARDAGCFVLPSVYEPWGVVVHEAALMGLPLLCSNQIQSATAYLIEGENGYLFNPLDEDDIASAFRRVMALGDDELLAMGRRSHQLGMTYTLSDWCRTALEFVGAKSEGVGE